VRRTAPSLNVRAALAASARRLWRVAAVIGIIAATTFHALPSDANHEIMFSECDDDSPSPSPDGEPELTPPPTEPPEDDQTPPPEAERTPPPQDCMPPEGDRIWGMRALRFSVDEGIRPTREARLYILSNEKGLPSANEGNALASWTGPEETYSFNWDSVGATPRNGKYKIRVEVESEEPHAGGSATIAQERVDMRVDNPPSAVGRPRILATTIGSVTIEWPAAKEPDTTGYTIYRATTNSKSKRPPYSAFRQVGQTTGPAFRNATPPGVHWYTVRVTRRSIITPNTGISSPLSSISGPAEVKSLQQIEKAADDGKPAPQRFIPFRQLAPPRPSGALTGLPDAPFAYKLPYGKQKPANFGTADEGSEEPGGDPRGAVLPLAVGMFLVSSALAVGRMPY
jgi:hypothetical protein